MDKNITIDKSVNWYDDVLSMTKNAKYEEAYAYLIINTDNTEKNSIMKEWVMALCEFYVYNKKEDAIKLLETLVTNKLESTMGFRVYNSLIIFCYSTNNRSKFYNYVKIIDSTINSLNDEELKINIFYSIANGCHDFGDYKTAINYSSKCIKKAREAHIINKCFIFALIVRIASNYQLDNYSDLIQDFGLYHNFYYVIGNTDINIDKILLDIKVNKKIS
jgi:tetratricopeptide (TPR) repeat protein